MAFRRSRRLFGLEPEFAGIESICGVCEKEIDVNLRNCKITICCSRPIHKKCLRDLLNANGPCPYCGMNFDVLSGRLKKRALEELEKLMEPEDIMAAITLENGIIVGDEDRQALVSTFRSILALLHDFINYDIRQNVCLVGGVRVSLRMTVRSNAEYMENFMRSFIPLEVRPFLNLSIGVRNCSQERLISYQLVY